METATINSYVTTLQGIAANHKLIQHTEQSKHFATVCTAAFVNEFGSVNIDEVLNGVRSLLKTPCLVADLPVIKITDPNAKARKKEYVGGFLILMKTAGKNLYEETVDISTCATIADQVMGWLDEKFLKAEEEGNAQYEWAIDFDNVEIVPITKLKDGWVGVRVNFSFRNESEIAFEYNPTAFFNPM